MHRTRENEPVLNLMLADQRAQRRAAAIEEDAGRARTVGALLDRRSIGVTRERVDADEF